MILSFKGKGYLASTVLMLEVEIKSNKKKSTKNNSFYLKIKLKIIITKK